MSSLFWRLFFGFWLVISALLLAHWGTTWLVTQQFESSERLERILQGYADAAHRAWTEAGPQGLRRWQQTLWVREGVRVQLLDEDGRPLVGPGRGWLPRHMMHGPERGRRPLLWRFGKDGTEYTLVILNPHALRDPLFAGFTLAWRILLSIAVVGLLAALMARWLTRPVALLQQASRSFAGGQLGTRVPESLTRRRDELGALGRDFNHMADRIERMIEGQKQLLRDVSHELRSPLARQRVALELARRKPDPAAELDRIEAEAEQLDQLIGEILDWVRLDAATELRRERFDLAALLQELAEAANLGRTRVRLCSPGPCPVEAEERLIRRAVDNLIRNALKYSQDEVELILRQNEREVEIEVADRGPGVAPALLERIFEPFVRTDSARSRDAGGWGLGLAIAARAVQRHGGTIRAENRPDGGLSVRISLPGLS